MGYINKAYLQTQLENLAARISAVFAKTTDIPTKTSQLENDSGYKTTDNTLTNNLLATVPGTALDAVQGKVLDDKIEAVNASLSVKIIEFSAKTNSSGNIMDILSEEHTLINIVCNENYCVLPFKYTSGKWSIHVIGAANNSIVANKALNFKMYYI